MILKRQLCTTNPKLNKIVLPESVPNYSRTTNKHFRGTLTAPTTIISPFYTPTNIDGLRFLNSVTVRTLLDGENGFTVFKRNPVTDNLSLERSKIWIKANGIEKQDEWILELQDLQENLTNKELDPIKNSELLDLLRQNKFDNLNGNVFNFNVKYENVNSLNIIIDDILKNDSCSFVEDILLFLLQDQVFFSKNCENVIKCCCYHIENTIDDINEINTLLAQIFHSIHINKVKIDNELLDCLLKSIDYVSLNYASKKKQPFEASLLQEVCKLQIMAKRVNDVKSLLPRYFQMGKLPSSEIVEQYLLLLNELKLSFALKNFYINDLKPAFVKILTPNITNILLNSGYIVHFNQLKYLLLMILNSNSAVAILKSNAVGQSLFNLVGILTPNALENCKNLKTLYHFLLKHSNELTLSQSFLKNYAFTCAKNQNYLVVSQILPKLQVDPNFVGELFLTPSTHTPSSLTDFFKLWREAFFKDSVLPKFFKMSSKIQDAIWHNLKTKNEKNMLFKYIIAKGHENILPGLLKETYVKYSKLIEFYKSNRK
ncbi:uncharacterized protein SCDLUD_003114 [Saccharomycodes ludwigii]|uniref:uncharacterized protein n=1 Tax=Saccharomycodes ludwigii TaxID=36035 RepID=UPI001E8757B4|nr:hypothetical protein SCDLUD_003114 [Saccharomycodes ludwigii]KAH3900144.1 hypothetical protein SCDLUD_003114 [Saccharomycodes ludwigii]